MNLMLKSSFQKLQPWFIQGLFLIYFTIALKKQKNPDNMRIRIIVRSNDNFYFCHLNKTSMWYNIVIIFSYTEVDFDFLRFVLLKFSNLYLCILIFMICHVEIPNGRTDYKV